jgi:hypothetical protein
LPNVRMVTSFLSSTVSGTLGLPELGVPEEVAGVGAAVGGAFDFCGCGCGLMDGDCNNAAELAAGAVADDAAEGLCAGATVGGGVTGNLDDEFVGARFAAAGCDFVVCERRVQSTIPTIKINPATTISLHDDPVLAVGV